MKRFFPDKYKADQKRKTTNKLTLPKENSKQTDPEIEMEICLHGARERGENVRTDATMYEPKSMFSQEISRSLASTLSPSPSTTVSEAHSSLARDQTDA